MNPPPAPAINPSRLLDSLDQMAQIGATNGRGVTRLALSDADKAARDLLWRWMGDAALDIQVDDFGNMTGRREGPLGKSVQVGSHLDTVVNGGRFDGVLGVLAGLEVVRALNDASIVTAHPIELINWTNEEGARFQPAMLGSGAATGVFDRDWARSRADTRGRRLGDELSRIGYDGRRDHRPSPGIGYMELHIEQGPVLERANNAIGVVEGIVGITWIDIIVQGHAAHAGPTPIDERSDALVAAAEIVSLVRRIGSEHGPPSAATVGRFVVEPNIVNTIPGRVTMSVDVRATSLAALDEIVARLQDGVKTCAGDNLVTIDLDRFWTSEPTRFDADLIRRIERSAHSLGFQPPTLWSGAGHDAKYMADVGSAAMIFVRSRGGVSHCEEELRDGDDIMSGARILLDTVVDLAGHVTIDIGVPSPNRPEGLA